MITRRTPARGMATATAVVTLLAGCQFSAPGPGTSTPPGFVLPTITHTVDGGSSPDRTRHVTSDAVPDGMVPAPGGSGYQRYFNQSLTWGQCADENAAQAGMECAAFLAPLDWADPDGQWAITVAMSRFPHTTGEGRILFVNPGGPGGSAQDYAQRFPREGLEAFDIVGLDPRGSGESTPVVCGDGPQTDAFLLSDATPDDEAERSVFQDAQAGFNRLCREHSGALLDHISSVQAVHDHDLARRLMGREKFSFHGVSYGTYLGSLMAELYPGRLEAAVLDSAVMLDPEDETIQAEGFDLALWAFADWCSQQDNCSLGSSPGQVVDAIVGYVDSLDASPVPAGEGRMLTQSLAVSGILVFLYFNSEAYPQLANVLLAAVNGHPDFLLQAADLMNDRDADGSYDTLMYAFPAIRCADEADDGITAAWQEWEKNQTRAPVFGRLSGVDLVCPLWTAVPDPVPDFSAKEAPPLLVVQNTGDSATPFHNAEVMAAKLETATLVVRESAGHGAFGDGSSCIDQIVVDYLVNGDVPAEGTRCTDG